MSSTAWVLVALSGVCGFWLDSQILFWLFMAPAILVGARDTLRSW